MNYQELKELLKGKDQNEVYSSTNQNGENVLISFDEETIEVRTLQYNGWIRVETYWEDGTIEETFIK